MTRRLHRRRQAYRRHNVVVTCEPSPSFVMFRVGIRAVILTPSSLTSSSLSTSSPSASSSLLLLSRRRHRSRHCHRHAMVDVDISFSFINNDSPSPLASSASALSPASASSLAPAVSSTTSSSATSSRHRHCRVIQWWGAPSREVRKDRVCISVIYVVDVVAMILIDCVSLADAVMNSGIYNIGHRSGRSFSLTSSTSAPLPVSATPSSTSAS